MGVRYLESLLLVPLTHISLPRPQKFLPFVKIRKTKEAQ